MAGQGMLDSSRRAVFHMLRPRIEELARRIQTSPLVLWILAGFLIAYLLFFVVPVFLSANSMQRFEPAPAADRLGIDLKMRLSWSAFSLDAEATLPDGDGTVFPPFANLVFAPLLSLRFSTAYTLLTVLTVLLYVAATLWLPALIRADRRVTAIAILICATGLLSYGFQFELERGQWNAITMFLALTALWIFHRHDRWRLLSYLLFVISVQLKLYPLVLLPLFISDLRRWRENAIRIVLLAVVNVPLFFVQGSRALGFWLSGLGAWASNVWIWEGNPSIHSALTLASNLAARRGWPAFSSISGPLEIVLSLAVVACLASILVRAYRNRLEPPSAHYLLAAAIGCLLIPSGGYDYRLTILGGPLILVYLSEEAADRNVTSSAPLIARRSAILLLSFAYATTLFPWAQKPYFLSNNFPALFATLLVVTWLALTFNGAAPAEPAPAARGLSPG